jgi:protein-L-isoaspartate(D-aspartate) O-methyltransferase
MTRSGQSEALEGRMREAREEMVALLRERGISDERVLAALRSVRRHAFFPAPVEEPLLAYGDFPFPIGWGATISQPYIVAYMTERLALAPGERVLEIGTGSGYQAAVLAAMGQRVWSLEVVPELADHARRALTAEGVASVQVRCANGYEGWREEAPFDAVLATCAPAAIPDELVAQLADGGRLILPVGAHLEAQQLLLVRRRGDTVTCEGDLPVRFVPMVRPAEQPAGEGRR